METVPLRTTVWRTVLVPGTLLHRVQATVFVRCQSARHTDHLDRSRGMTKKSDAGKSKDKGDRKRRRSLAAYARLQRAAALAASAADASLAVFELSASQLGVLETLDARGPVHQQEIARTLGRSKAQMTAIIDVLERRQLVRRERHATDRRFTTVHLTDEGRTLLASAAPVRADAVVNVMSALSGDQRARLSRLCRRVVRSLAPDEADRDTGDDDSGEDSPDDESADAPSDSNAALTVESAVGSDTPPVVAADAREAMGR